MKLQYAGSCGVIFQRLAHVLQIAFLDRRGSRGPSHCRGSRRWRGSAARRGGPRRKTEKQGEHFTPLTLHEHTGHSAALCECAWGMDCYFYCFSQSSKSAWILGAPAPGELSWVSRFCASSGSRSCEWRAPLIIRLILSQSGDPEVKCIKLQVP